MIKPIGWGWITLDGKLICDDDESPCDVCYQPVEKNRWVQYGGDGFRNAAGDYLCAGLADAPAVTECEFCGAMYQDGERYLW